MVALTLPRYVAPEPEDTTPELPVGALEGEAYLAALTAAQELFAEFVRFPGHVFTEQGTYVDIFDISAIYAATPGDEIPVDLYLFPENYLVPEAEREARLLG